MYKNDFEYFNNTRDVYLDNAATTQKPAPVLSIMTDYYTKYCANTHRSNHSSANKATSLYEQSRTFLKEFIHARHDHEIIFTKGVTEGINFIASSYVASRFDTVIISSLEHHSNIVPWHMQGRTLHKGLEVVKCNENLDFDLIHFEELLKKHANAFVSITHISNAFGKIHPLSEIINLTHKYNAKILVDGAQSMAHLPLDMQKLDVDFYVLSSHKTFGPTGTGAVYIKEEHLKKCKPYQTGGASINDVSFKKSTLLDSPYMFEAGTQNIAGVLGFYEALKYIKNIGYEKLHDYEKEIYVYLYKELSHVEGIEFYCDTKNSIGSLSFNIKDVNQEDIGILLDKQHVLARCGHHCAQPIMKKLNIEGTIRVSIAFYNDKYDINKFILALKKAIAILKK